MQSIQLYCCDAYGNMLLSIIQSMKNHSLNVQARGDIRKNLKGGGLLCTDYSHLDWILSHHVGGLEGTSYKLYLNNGLFNR